MSEWKEYSLGEIAEITSSKRVYYSDYVESGIPFWRSKEVIERYNGKEITTELFISEEHYDYIKSKFGVPQQNDILLTSVGSLGIPYIVKIDDRFYFKDGNLVWIRNIDTSKLSPLYLFKWLSSDLAKNALGEITIGSTQEALTIVGLKSLILVLPSLPEQKAIASVLCSLDDKIDLLHRQNVTLEKMAETIFRQWFEGNNSTKEYITEFIEFNPTRKMRPKSLSPYLEMSNISTTSFHPIDWYEREYTSGMKFVNGDTILARITPCLENGKTAFITFLKDDQVGWGSTEYIVMRSKIGLHPFLTYLLAKNKDFRDYAEGCLEGTSGRQRVNIDHLVKYQLSLPSDKDIDRFNAVMRYVADKLHNNYLQSITLIRLRDSLLPKLMSGEVKVKI